MCIFAFYFGFNMDRVKALSVVILLVLCCFQTQGQVQDSVDVTDYDITLDLSTGAPFHGDAVLTLQLLRPCATVSLDLIGVVDSVELAGTRLSTTSLAALPTSGIAVLQPFTIHVWYSCQGYVESGGWGGMHFDNDMSYNLGVGFNADPHVMGRAFFPCRDNFTDKATYTFHVRTRAGWTAECGGMLQSRTTNDDGTESSVWHIAQPTPTYLVSVSQAAWKRIYDTIPSLYGNYPATYGYLSPTANRVQQVFAELDSVVPMFERCFGPYRWGRIGYIATNRGSMEHVNNIGLAKQAMSSISEAGQSTIAHELGHAWFGNLITCSSESDMWINEGGASFTSEVAMEAVNGRAASDDYYQRNLENVLRTTHHTDGSYRALSPMPHNYTYGSTTYDKGWMVWHSLRGYLGEEVFYNAIQHLMDVCAFGNIDSYSLRDSLSLYTGVDLTDFFDFHVFSPGFVDYNLEYVGNLTSCGGDNRFHIRQQSVGTSQSPASHRIPMTVYFYNDDSGTPTLDSVKHWITFDGSENHFSLGGFSSIGFDPVFCVLDRDCEISDAAIVDGTLLEGYGVRQTLSQVHMRVRSEDSVHSYPKYFYVEHHMAPAMDEMPEGVVRQAGRYWVLRGTWTPEDHVAGFFRFIRTGSSSNYPNLDYGFYNMAATADSLALFYRPNSDTPWMLCSHVREGNTNEGWMVAENIEQGEYTLAVVDFERLAIDSPDPVMRDLKQEINLFPNPLGKGQPLTIDIDTNIPFTVRIVDSEGRLVWQRDDCRSGQNLDPKLPKGSYIVQIENKTISLQSKLIQL